MELYCRFKKLVMSRQTTLRKSLMLNNTLRLTICMMMNGL